MVDGTTSCGMENVTKINGTRTGPPHVQKTMVRDKVMSILQLFVQVDCSYGRLEKFLRNGERDKKAVNST